MAFDTRKVNYRAALLTGIIIPSWQEQSPNPLFDQRPRVASRLLRPALLLLAQDKARRGVDPPDRKSVVSGKSVSVRVDLGGRRRLNKKKRILLLLLCHTSELHNNTSN